MDTRARLLAAGWFVGAVALALTGCDSGPSPTSESSLSTPGAATGGVTSRPTGDPRQIDGRLDRVVFLDKDVAYASWVLTPPAPGVGGPLAWATTRTRDGWGHSRRLGRADLLGRATPLLSSDGSVVLSGGVEEEVQIALRLGKPVIPVGMTGNVAQTVWEEAYKAPDRYLPGIDSKAELEMLGNATATVQEIVQAVSSLLIKAVQIASARCRDNPKLS